MHDGRLRRGQPGAGAADGQQDYSWSLDRSTASYSTVTLQPGDGAHFDLVYLPSSVGTGADIVVDTLVVTPPNTYTQAQVTFDKSILLQDAATHPGTYITPVVPGV